MKKLILVILLLAFCVSISSAGVTDKLRAVIAAKNAGDEEPPAPGSTFTFVASSVYDSASSASATCSKPTGTVENDIIFALTERNNTTAATVVPDGWSVAGNHNYSTNFLQTLYYKVAGDSEGADYTWTWGEATTRMSLTCVTYRGGFNTTDPIDVVSNTQYITDDYTWRAADMTVSAANSALVLTTSVYLTTEITYTKPSVPTTDWQEDIDYFSATGDHSRAFYSMTWSGSGATGNMDATGSATENTNKHTFAVALNPE